jgi:hypothetical protein
MRLRLSPIYFFNLINKYLLLRRITSIKGIHKFTMLFQITMQCIVRNYRKCVGDAQDIILVYHSWQYLEQRNLQKAKKKWYSLLPLFEALIFERFSHTDIGTYLWFFEIGPLLNQYLKINATNTITLGNKRS